MSETLEQTKERIRRQAMRDHPFEPMKRDARYCGFMGAPATSGSEATGYVSLQAECGYPPELHPPVAAVQPPGRASEPQPIGSGAHEVAEVRTARKAYPCHESQCTERIKPGDQYVRAITFPSHEIMTGALRVWTFCLACATRYGRPLPPMRPRQRPRSGTVDLEAVRIAASGERTLPLNLMERRLVVRQLTDKGGLTTGEIGRRAGISARSVQRMRARWAS